MNQSEVPTNAADLDAFNATQKKNQLEFTNECNAVLKRPYAFHARLEVEFEIMPTIVNGAA